jgi:hypothetical protein
MKTRFVRGLLWICLGSLGSLSSCHQGDSDSMASSDALPILGPMKLVPNDQGGQDTVKIRPDGLFIATACAVRFVLWIFSLRPAPVFVWT